MNKVAAFQGMHVSPAKHSYAWLPRKCDYWTDARTDKCRTKLSLCAAMLCRRHKNLHTIKEWVSFFLAFIAYESEYETNKSHQRRSGSRAICLFCAQIHSPWTKKKRNLFLIFTTFPSKISFNSPRKVINSDFLYMGNLNFIWCKSLHVWYAQLMKLLVDICHSVIIIIDSDIFTWLNEGNITVESFIFVGNFVDFR